MLKNQYLFNQHKTKHSQQANGNLGQTVLPSIVNASFQVTVITRAESTSAFPPNVKVVKTEYTEKNIAEALHGQDAVICLIDAGALKVESLIIDAAASAGVKWFIPSEFGHNTLDKRVLEALPILQGKVKVTAQLRAKEQQGMQWTGIVTGLFFDWVIFFFFWQDPLQLEVADYF